MAKKKSKATNTFQVGDQVRVRHGFRDANYPDLPLGGWAGTITEAHDKKMYCVRWSRETLAAIHPVYKNRCEIDGLNHEEYGFQGADLEPDTGGPLNIEHPTEILTRPLSVDDEDDRIRMVFGLTSNDLLPDADYETLQAYQKHLANHLEIPFQAVYTGGYGSAKPATVLGLGDPADEAMVDEHYGLLCEARLEKQLAVLALDDLEIDANQPNRQLLRDYSYWFANWC